MNSERECVSADIPKVCTRCGDDLIWLPVKGFDETEKLICGACRRVHGYREKESKKVTDLFFDDY